MLFATLSCLSSSASFGSKEGKFFRLSGTLARRSGKHHASFNCGTRAHVSVPADMHTVRAAAECATVEKISIKFSKRAVKSVGEFMDHFLMDRFE